MNIDLLSYELGVMMCQSYLKLADYPLPQVQIQGYDIIGNCSSLMKAIGEDNINYIFIQQGFVAEMQNIGIANIYSPEIVGIAYKLIIEGSPHE